MSNDTHIVNAITGECITTNIRFFMVLDEFKHFICQKWNIPWDELLVLLPFGDKLKISSFNECLRNDTISKEFHVYDRRLFSIINEPKLLESTFNDDMKLIRRSDELLGVVCDESVVNREYSYFKPIPSPLEDVDLNIETLTYRTVTSLLTTNLGWLSALEIDVHYFREIIKQYLSETSSILKCLSICEQYLKLYCYDVEKLYNSNVRYLDQLANIISSNNWRSCSNDILGKLHGLHGPLKQYINLESLDKTEMDLKSLDSIINEKLKGIKKELDQKADLRNKLTTTIEILQKEFAPENIKDNLEKMMLDKFEELVKNTRITSREILEQDFEETSNADLNNTREYLSNIKSGVIGKLSTIAKAVYAHSQKVLEQKRTLQKKAILTLGQIAFVQMEILAIKKVLLNDCSKELDLYQKLELEFAQVEDMPLIYGLYLIEIYRRQIWIAQVMTTSNCYIHKLKEIKEEEKHQRTSWMEKFGATALIFSNELNDTFDFDQIDKWITDGSNSKGAPHNNIDSLKSEISTTLKVIELYMKQLETLGVSRDIIDILTQSLLSANNLDLKLFSIEDRITDSLKTTSSRQINGYKARIKRLESLLHDSKYSDPGRWPSGILNTNYLPFHSNIATIGSKVALNSSTITETTDTSSMSKMVEMQRRIEEMEDQINMLTKEKLAKETLLNVANFKITDFELEKTAFKESLSHLNTELARLTEEEGKRERDIIQLQKGFRTEIEEIIQENKKVIYDSKLVNNTMMELQNEKSDLLLEIKNLKEKLIEEHDTFDVKYRNLIKTNTNLENEITNLKKTNENIISKEPARLYAEQAVQTLDGETKSKSLVMSIASEHEDLSGKIEEKMFEVFTSDVFILENIGLLLVADEDDSIKIKRVKGLKKGQNIGILDDSTQIPENNAVLKSSVFREIKNLYEQVKNSTELDRHEDFMNNLNQIYQDKLFENAVIGRFKDIEFLAKKLTKENKRKKGLLETYQKERLALRNFQIGDLALFLPTREYISSCDSSESSLISSFSSVDLSTPPPFDAATLHYSPSARKEKVTKMRKSQPWAAFTAFEDNTRYFLKDETGVIKGRDWFVGRILNLESHLVDDRDINPFKLPKGTVWFYLTAGMGPSTQ